MLPDQDYARMRWRGLVAAARGAGVRVVGARHRETGGGPHGRHGHCGRARGAFGICPRRARRRGPWHRGRSLFVERWP
eukprot:1740296-Alexandrium_andersonii.AAC.1